MQDSKFLHFLKEFPAWIVLVFLLCGLTVVWFISERSFLEHLIDTAMGGLLTLLIGRKVSATQTGNTVTGDVINLPEPDKPTEEIKPIEDLEK